MSESTHSRSRGSGVSPRRDLPFPVVYFGFLVAFITTQWEMLTSNGPTLEMLSQGSLIPGARAAVLPIVSFLFVCPALYVWRSLVKKMVFSPLAVSFAGHKPGSIKHEKFCEQGWLAVHYILATSLGYCVLRDKPWWPPMVNEKAGAAISATQAEREADQEDLSLAVLYSMQLGFYTLELVSLLMAKNRRSDAVVYFLHHIFTLFLMAGSWVSYNHRIGTLVLFLHDIGDIFLPIGKCFSYAEAHVRTTQSASRYAMHKALGMCFFALFVVLFAVPRLIFYGGLIYQGFAKYHWYRCCGIDVTTGYCGQCPLGIFYTTPLLSVLGLLYPMHVFWFYLIVKMAIRLMFSPDDYDDVRSDVEKED